MSDEHGQPDLAAWSTPDLLRGALRLYRRNAPTFIGVLAVAFAVTAGIQAASTLPSLTETSALFLSAVSMMVAGTGSLALARAALRRLHGQPASIGDAYGFILDRLSGYVGLLLLMAAIALGVGLVGAIASGLLLSLGLGPLGLIVGGGLTLAVVLTLALVPFGFAEGLPVMETLERSRTLAQREWPALLLNLLLYAVPFGIGFWLLPRTTWGMAIDVLVNVVYTPFPLAFLGMIYRRALSASPDPTPAENENA